MSGSARHCLARICSDIACGIRFVHSPITYYSVVEIVVRFFIQDLYSLYRVRNCKKIV